MTIPTPTWQVLRGDARKVLRGLEENSVQTFVTSIPYWSLRDYGLEPSVWGGQPDCEHVWGDELSEHHPGQVNQTKWKNNDAVANGQTAGAGQFCKRCGAWRGSLGLEPILDLYLDHLVEIFNAARRPLHPSGTIWVNCGDSMSSGVSSNLLDCLEPFHKSDAMIFRNTATIRITTHSINVAETDNSFPYGKLFSLFGIKRITIKQRNNDFCQVIHCLATPTYCWIGCPVSFLSRNSSNLEIVLDADYIVSIIISDHEGDNMPVVGIPVRPLSVMQGDTTFTIEKSAEPITERVGDGETIGDSFSFDAPLKCFPDIYLVDKTIPFPDSVSLGGSSFSDLRIVEASEKHLTLSSESCGVNILASFVRHSCYLLKDGLLTPYDIVYAKAIRLSNSRKAKQEMSAPERVKLALQEDGWICRSTIVWAKGIDWSDQEREAQETIRQALTDVRRDAAGSLFGLSKELDRTLKRAERAVDRLAMSGAVMPESVDDRPTSAHEMVFLLSQSERYYYDRHAITIPQSPHSHSRGECHTPKESLHGQGIRANDSWHETTHQLELPAGRNARDVWRIPVENHGTFLLSTGKEVGHFAAYPTALAERAILAGTSMAGCCATCRSPFRRVVAPTPEYARHLRQDWADYDQDAAEGRGHSVSGQRPVKRSGQGLTADYITIGWLPTCTCHGDPVDGEVTCPDCFGLGDEKTTAQRQADHFPEDDQRKSGKRGAIGNVGENSMVLTEAPCPTCSGFGHVPGKVFPQEALEKWPRVPCTVGDMFAGSGQTGRAALKAGRSSVQIDLNPDYCLLMEERLTAFPDDLKEVRAKKKQSQPEDKAPSMQLELLPVEEAND